MEYNKIIQGDTLKVLKTLPDEIINCCVTSPPYWGLRDYGTTPQIWDGNKDCKHKWNIRKYSKVTNYNEGFNQRWENSPNKIQKQSEMGKIRNIEEGFCSKCGAWRGSLGLEPTFELYIKHLCDIFDEVNRVLRNDGTCWVNLGDSYNGNKTGNTNGIYKNRIDKSKSWANSDSFKKAEQDIPAKSLCLIPQRFAIEMVNRGWILRNTIIWHKPNCMPSSAKDRFTVDFEYLYFFSKSKKYYFEQQFEPYQFPLDRWGGIYTDGNVPNSKYLKENIDPAQITKRPRSFRSNEKGRNKRTVWKIPTKPFPDAHFAVFPEALIETPIQAGCPKGGIVLDPFMGAGTTAVVSLKQGKRYLGIELKQEYIDIANKRIKAIPLKLFK